jgi:hypothetical protein
MKKVLFGLSLLACAAAATAQVAADADTLGGGAHCIAFTNFVDGMQYDSGRKATWHNWDGAGSQGVQTKASYRKGTTFCDGAKGCNPAAAAGYDSLSWAFNLTANTGTLTGVYQGTTYTLQLDTPIAITTGACTFNGTQGGVSSLSR